ncbi:MAG TPA: hemolysin family protein [Candidatus Polarisedimenticolaceae bacterium]|nr:hemolysin family protein [Candidatus Polarisedimenticolaceae bacterium]
MKDLLYVLLALGLVALNAFFVATEFAIVRVRTTRIDELVAKGVRRAAATRTVLQDLNAYLSACQLGITLASLGLGWVGKPAFAHLLEPLMSGLGLWSDVTAASLSITLAFAIITFLHVVLGELAPKTIAIERAEATALLIAWPIRIFNVLLFPFIWSMNGLANLAVRALGLRAVSEGSLAHSEEELRMILSVSQRSGMLPEAHAQLLENALDFTERAVRQIMVPRADIVWLDARRPYEDNVRIVRESAHTRYPLCEGDVDHVVGVLNLKDLFLQPPGMDLRQLARKPLFVPEGVSIDRVLRQFQRSRTHLAVVIDEYGGTSGVVSIEDVLEELIGEIQDEFDEEAPKVQDLGGGRLSVDASVPADEIAETLGIHDGADEEVDTLGGLVVARLGRIARPGDVVTLGNHRVEVSRMRGRRIVRLTVHPATPS